MIEVLKRVIAFAVLIALAIFACIMFTRRNKNKVSKVSEEIKDKLIKSYCENVGESGLAL